MTVGPKESNLVSFTSNVSEATCMIQRVGNRAGKVTFDRDEMEKKKTSKNFYFVKLSLNENQTELLNDLCLENCSSKNKTSGMPSISKPEAVKMIHDHFDN